MADLVVSSFIQQQIDLNVLVKIYSKIKHTVYLKGKKNTLLMVQNQNAYLLRKEDRVLTSRC